MLWLHWIAQISRRPWFLLDSRAFQQPLLGRKVCVCTICVWPSGWGAGGGFSLSWELTIPIQGLGNWCIEKYGERLKPHVLPCTPVPERAHVGTHTRARSQNLAGKCWGIVCADFNSQVCEVWNHCCSGEVQVREWILALSVQNLVRKPLKMPTDQLFQLLTMTFYIAVCCAQWI